MNKNHKIIKNSHLLESISIIFIDDDSKEEVYQYFKKHDCYCEYGEFDGYNMLAVSVDKDLDHEIQSYNLCSRCFNFGLDYTLCFPSQVVV